MLAGSMDWINWQPREHANLCFLVKDGSVLLIHKKRGLGAGKVNGPGGKLEPGESPRDAAIRECEEEIGVTPIDPEERGVLHFQFTDGYSLKCHVFVASEFKGEPMETAEAKPFWSPVDAIPFDEMWEDDRHWLPGMLAGQQFRAWFHFDGERMLSMELKWIE